MNNLVLFLPLLLGGVLLLFLIVSVLNMLLMRKRLASFRINPAQIPLASEQPLPLLILKGHHPPITLTKRLSRGTHMLLIVVWFGISVTFTLVTVFSTRSSSSNLLVTLSEILAFWTAYWIVLQGSLTVMFYQHIEANEGGLLVQRGVIRRRISWDQARLFAIDHINGRGTTSTQYELSGIKQIVRWGWMNTKRPLPQFTLKPAPPEYQRETERLMSYIHERTGLPLRDFPAMRKEYVHSAGPGHGQHEVARDG